MKPCSTGIKDHPEAENRFQRFLLQSLLKKNEQIMSATALLILASKILIGTIMSIFLLFKNGHLMYNGPIETKA